MSVYHSYKNNPPVIFDLSGGDTPGAYKVVGNFCYVLITSEAWNGVKKIYRRRYALGAKQAPEFTHHFCSDTAIWNRTGKSFGLSGLSDLRPRARQKCNPKPNKKIINLFRKLYGKKKLILTGLSPDDDPNYIVLPHSENDPYDKVQIQIKEKEEILISLRSEKALSKILEKLKENEIKFDLKGSGVWNYGFLTDYEIRIK